MNTRIAKIKILLLRFGHQMFSIDEMRFRNWMTAPAHWRPPTTRFATHTEYWPTLNLFVGIQSDAEETTSVA
jgi:hypothetical protein